MRHIVNPSGVPHYSRSIPTLKYPKCQVKYYYFDERRVFGETGIRSDITLADGLIVSPVVITRHRHGKLWSLLDKMMQELASGTDDSYRIAAH